ncbi:MAG: transcription termination factor Rho, partial [Coriobacteriaceae bacterium]|nr:transcription termination factor Rho [Coriobacteriaceae bacterium]
MTDETPSDSMGATPAETPEEAPKPRRRRRTRAEIEADKLAKAAAAQAASADGQTAAEEAPKPRRRRVSKKKPEDVGAAQGELPLETAPAAPAAAGTPDAAPEEAPKPRRRRRTRAQIEADERAKAQAAENGPAASEHHEPKPADDSGRDQASFSEMTRLTQEATQASSVPAPMPAATLAEADHTDEQQGRYQRQSRDHGQRGGEQQQGRRRRVSYNNSGNNRYGNGNGGDGNGFNRRGQQYHKQHGRHGGQQAQSQPSLSRDELRVLKVADLRTKAASLGVEYVGVHKSDLVEAVYLAAAAAEGFHPVDGILEIGNAGAGWIRTGTYMKGDNDAYVSQQFIRNYALRPGDRVEGTVGPARTNTKYPVQYPPIISIARVNGRDPESARNRPRFRDLTPIYPNERLVMECGKDSITGRAIDLVAPIGKGQRGLIVSPPKAGKTTVLKKICQSIAANNPEVHLVCLLVDERPEEVTDMQRS